MLQKISSNMALRYINFSLFPPRLAEGDCTRVRVFLIPHNPKKEQGIARLLVSYVAKNWVPLYTSQRLWLQYLFNMYWLPWVNELILIEEGL